MSNHLAIATVTAALGQRVYGSAQGAVGGIGLRFGRPMAPAAGTTERRVYVYLYQVTPNAALRNADLPQRNSDGRLAQRPQAALELHYLVSFYGDDQVLEPDRMLGAVLRDLHTQPLLSAQNIADAILGHSELADSDLGQAIDRVRLTPATLSLDEQSRLWSVLMQTPHALSTLLTASVVLIDAVTPAAAALPVLRRGDDDRGADASVGGFPRLDEAWVGFVESAGRQPRLPSLRAAQLGARLLVQGSQLGGDVLSLRLLHPARPALVLTIPPSERDAQQLALTLPDDAAAQTDWAAGLYSVVATVQRGAQVLRSPVWPLLLAPRISAVAPNPAARVGGAVTLSVTCRPQVQPGQAASLLVGEREVNAEPLASAGDTLQFVFDPAPAVNAQLVWLQVDGAMSQPVRVDPANGLFAFDDVQRVTIT